MLELVSAKHLESKESFAANGEQDTEVSELAKAWEVLEDLLKLYTSGDVDSFGAENTVVRARDPQIEADRVVEEQVVVVQKVIETPSETYADMVAKLRIWKETVGADMTSEFTQTPDYLVLSVLEDLENMIGKAEQNQSKSVG